LQKTEGFRNFIISSGCDVPSGTPLENIDAFFETLKEYNASKAHAGLESRRHCRRSMMLYKNDWDIAKKRFEAFWECDMLDRCCISITAPKKKSAHADHRAQGPGESPAAMDRRGACIQYLLLRLRSRIFRREAIPATAAYLGPGVVAAFLGSDYTLKEDTVWYGREPVLKDWSGRKPLHSTDSMSCGAPWRL